MLPTRTAVENGRPTAVPGSSMTRRSWATPEDHPPARALSNKAATATGVRTRMSPFPPFVDVTEARTSSSMLQRIVEGLRRVIARAEARPRLGVRPEGRWRTGVLQDALAPRARFRASNQSTSGLEALRTLKKAAARA